MSRRYQDKSNMGIILNINEFIVINVYPPGYCLYWSLETRHTLEKPLFAAGFKETWIPLKSHADTAHLSTEHLAHLTATTPFFQFDSCHHPTRKVLMIICQPSFSWQIFIFSVASSTDPRIVPTKTELRSFVTTIKPWLSIGFTWHKKIKGLSREIPAEKCAIVVIKGKKIA